MYHIGLLCQLLAKLEKSKDQMLHFAIIDHLLDQSHEQDMDYHETFL